MLRKREVWLKGKSRDGAPMVNMQWVIGVRIRGQGWPIQLQWNFQNWRGAGWKQGDWSWQGSGGVARPYQGWGGGGGGAGARPYQGWGAGIGTGWEVGLELGYWSQRWGGGRSPLCQ